MGILVHLYQESIRISAAKSLSEEAKIELRQLLDSQEDTVLQTVPKLLGGKVVRTAYGSTFVVPDDGGGMDSHQLREEIEDFIFEVGTFEYT